MDRIVCVLVVSVGILGLCGMVLAEEFDHVPGEVLVKFKPGSSASPHQQAGREKADRSGLSQARSMEPVFRGRDAHAQRSGDARVMPRSHRMPQGARAPDLGRTYRVRVDLRQGQSLDDLVRAYRKDPAVEYAELNYRVRLCRMPNDPEYGQQWALAKIGAAQAWDLRTGSTEVVVGLIDTGVELTHPDLVGNLWVNQAERNGLEGIDDDGNGYIDDVHGYDFANDDNEPLDDYAHGTHCAGIIAARGNNGTNITGICWDAKIMAMKCLDPDTLGATSDVAEAIYYAVANGADVLSNSWGMNPPSQTLKEALDYAYSQGVICVASAGNDNKDTPRYPAAYPNVISVGASSQNDKKASFSNYGSWVDLMAPGVNILSLMPWGTGPMQGTSMACPHVAGTVALMLSVNPYLGPTEVERILTTTGDPIPTGICKSNGRLNVFKALGGAVSGLGSVTLDQDCYPVSGAISVVVTDGDLARQGQCEVVLTTARGDTETVVLTEQAPAIGAFRGTVQAAPGGPDPNDGVLQTDHADRITVAYQDQRTGGGRGTGPRTATDTALVDGLAPLVYAVSVDASIPRPVVQFDTNEPTTALVRCTPAEADSIAAKGYGSGVPATRHRVELRGLAPQERYRFVIEARDRVGNVTLTEANGTAFAFVTVPDPCHVHVPRDFPTIQEAMDHCWDGDTVWLADGTYTGPGNRDLDFKGRAILVRSVNGPAACIIDCQGKDKDLHRGFYFHNRETRTSIVDGLTIMNGYQHEHRTNGTMCKGGAILCNGAGPLIRHCILSNNSASDSGGAVCAYNRSFPAISDCSFVGNACAYEGGAIACQDSSQAGISDCEFLRNTANFGGAVGLGFDSPVIRDCVFRENHARVMGGAILGGDRPLITHCRFIANTADFGGGAISLGNPNLSHCLFAGNRGQDYGGAIFMQGGYSAAVIRQCTFTGNLSTNGNALAFQYYRGDPFALQVSNSILWDGGREIWHNDHTIFDATYSDVQGGWPGQGNIDADPLFAQPGHWDPQGTPSDPNDDLWIDGDYHLRSQAGRWNPVAATWAVDAVTSPCIDAGDPNAAWDMEPQPNGSRVNLGAYGNTAEASMSP